MNRNFFILYAVFAFCISEYQIKAQHYNIQKDVIIDTDGGIDDLRAISLLFSVDETDIKAFVCSGGNLSPEASAEKLCNLLNYTERSIPVSIGPDTKSPPKWRKNSRHYNWIPENKENNICNYSEAGKILPQIIENNDEQITYLALGSLTIISDLLKNEPTLAKKIDEVIWYSQSVNPVDGSNYNFDTAAADYLLHRAMIPLTIISNLDKKNAFYDDALLKQINTVETQNAAIIKNLAQQFTEKNPGSKMKIWDDLIPVYLLYPEFFEKEKNLQQPNISFVCNYKLELIKEKIPKILNSDYPRIKNVVFEQFPHASYLFREDLAPYVDEIFENHGIREWKAVILTNELHGHLGIYSIIGAKMGVKALEYLHSEVDEIKIESLAGNHPPVSCMNDGLQTSTGATLGQGTISILEKESNIPAAFFIYGDKKIKIELKQEYREQVKHDISEGIVRYGNLTDEYWKMVRRLAIKYWKDWDRNLIFTITETEK